MTRFILYEFIAVYMAISLNVGENRLWLERRTGATPPTAAMFCGRGWNPPLQYLSGSVRDCRGRCPHRPVLAGRRRRRPLRILLGLVRNVKTGGDGTPPLRCLSRLDRNRRGRCPHRPGTRIALRDHLIRLFAYGKNPPSPRGEGLFGQCEICGRIWNPPLRILSGLVRDCRGRRSEATRAAMNDSPVDCQNREWTEPQRDLCALPF